jgi:hypothetical protein
MRIRALLLSIAMLFSSVAFADDTRRQVDFLGEHWTRLTPPLLDLSVVDPVRGRVLLLPFGLDASPGEYWELGLTPGSRWRKQAWENAGPDWNTPIRAVTYDPALDRLIALAGSWTPGSLSVWSLNLGGDRRWVELATSGTAPVDRDGFAFVFDSRRDRYVLFGGQSKYGGPPMFNDVWDLRVGREVATWTPLETVGDSVTAHYQIGAIYDEKRDRMVVIGGARGLPGGGEIEPSDDLPTLEFGEPSRWKVFPRQHQPTGLDYLPRCLYEPKSDRMLVFGGATSTPIAIPLDDLIVSVELTPGDMLRGARAVGNLVNGDAIAVGGDREVRAFNPASFRGFERLDPPQDAIENSNQRPTGPSFAGGRNGVVYYWGGFLDKRPGSERELWRFDIRQDPHWSKLALSSAVPAPSQGASITYDGRRHRWLMYAGWSPSAPFAKFEELWAFDPLGPSWTRIELPGGTGPGSLEGAAAAYDGVRDRMILFGGRREAFSIGETWALSLGPDLRWSRLAVTGRQPRPRGNATTVWDPTRDRVVLFGGSTRSDGGIALGGVVETPRRDMWSLD